MDEGKMEWNHDSVIGDFCHIVSGCHIAWGVEIGNEVFLGIGSAVIPYVNIVSNIGRVRKFILSRTA